MPAYAPTRLAQKLGIRENTRYLFLGAPHGFTRELPTPKTARPVASQAAEVDLIVFFAPNLAVRTAKFAAPGR